MSIDAHIAAFFAFALCLAHLAELALGLERCSFRLCPTCRSAMRRAA